MFLALWMAGNSWAVEVCNNRLDDDHDGTVDCASADCSLDPGCCAGGSGDLDADGWCDALDRCVAAPDPAQADGDTDGVGDACDACASYGAGLLTWEAERLGGDTAGTVTLADVDGDGDVDALWSRDLDNALMLNDNAGSYLSPAVVVATGLDAITAIEAGDLDGDGDVDLVVAAHDTGDVVAIENLGGGAWGAPTVIASPGEPQDVVLTDLDGDGDPEVAWVSDYPGEVAWSENLGGVFGPAQVEVSEGWTWRIAAGDLDGDGDPDLLFGTQATGLLQWLENTGGGFAAAVDLPIGADSLSDLAIEDIDGDGVADAFAAIEYLLGPSTTDERLIWLRGLGGGAFAAPAIIDNHYLSLAFSTGFGDVDGDGDRDLVVADTRTHEVNWYESLGGGVFAASQAVVAEKYGAIYLAIRDLDGDAAADVMVGSLDVEVWRNHADCASADGDGDGVTDAEEWLVYGSDPAAAPAVLDLDGDGVTSDVDDCPWIADPGQIDADGDGHGDACEVCDGDDAAGDTDFDGVCDDLDLCRFVGDIAGADADADGAGDACDACPGIAGDGSTLFPPGDPLDLGLRSPSQLAATDVDGDGDVDLVYAITLNSGEPDYLDTSEIGWMRTDGGGVFVDQGPFSDDIYDGVGFDVADADADGDQDVVWASGEGTIFYHGFAGGSFDAGTEVADGLAELAVIRAADLDGDGDVDLAAIGTLPSAGVDRVRLLASTGGPSWVLVNTSPLAGDDTRSLAVGDLDADGDPDLVSAALVGDKVEWFENPGALAAFPPGTPLVPAVDGAFAVALADLDGDGALDLVVTALLADTVAWYANLGGGTFGPATSVSDDLLDLYETIPADFDADGDADLMVLVGQYPGALLYENLGGGAFAASVSVYSDGVGPGVAADYDGDGDLDLVAAFATGLGWIPNLFVECAGADTDGDGLTDGQEWQIYGTDVAVADTDGDGLFDGAEVDGGQDPLGWDPDPDGDGIENLLDLCPLVADPAQLDSDGDGVGDACDPTPLPPVDTGDTAGPLDTDVPLDTDAPPDTDLPTPGETGAVAARPEKGGPGCGCASAGRPGWYPALAGLVLSWRRRRAGLERPARA